MRRWIAVAVAAASLVFAAAGGARVLRVGSYKRIAGQFRSVQAAVNAAHRGDWILIGPGDYHEHGVKQAPETAGVLIQKGHLHIRGMNRNRVIIDGTKPGSRRCSSRPADQITTGRNGVEAFKANG